MTATAAALGALLFTGAPAMAQAPDPAAAPTFRPGVAERGWIRAQITGVPGSTIAIAEQVGAAQVPVTSFTLTDVAGGRQHLAPWRCDRQQRTFVMTATPPDGAAATTVRAEVLTPGCRHRLTLAVPGGSPRAGRPLAVVVGDHFGIGGIDGRVCLQGGGTHTCRQARIPVGRTSTTVRLTPRGAGRAQIRLDGPAGQRLTRTVTLARRPGPLTLLTTGDSDIQILQDLLAARAAPSGVRTVRDDHISTGISSTFELDWPAHTRAIAASVHPDVSVVFLGGNEGFAMRTPGGGSVACCGAPWVAEFARRAGGMMRDLSRDGAGHVYWLLVPAPRIPPRTRAYADVIDAVNRAYVEAARAYPDTVTIVDTRQLFPAGSARQPDGFHLTSGGYQALARSLFARMRRDGAL